MHLYERDVERAVSVLSLGPFHGQREPAPGLFAEVGMDATPAQRWHAISRAARVQAISGVVPVFHGAAWYNDNVPHLPGGAWLCHYCRYVTPHPCVECVSAGTENVLVTGERL